MAGPAQPIERKLVAIFAADVAGYSRLMGQDEVGTLRRLAAHREIMDRLIAQQRDGGLPHVARLPARSAQVTARATEATAHGTKAAF